MDVVTLGAAKADAKKKYNPKPVARRAVFLSGAPGTETTGTTDASGKGVIRYPVMLPFNTTRWRLKLRNYNTLAGTNGAGAVNFTGLAFGVMGASGTTNLETGAYAFNASTMVVPAISAAIPLDGTWYTSPWITDPAQQFQAATEHLLTAGYDTGTGSSATGIPRGVGFCWHLGGDPAATSGFTSGVPSLISATLFEWAIEYESTEINRVVLVLGDSITQAVGQSSTTVTQGQPRYRSWPDLWAVRNRTAVVSIGISGSMSGDWITDGTARWTRYDAANITFDAAILALGANDLNAATPITLAGYQSNITILLNFLKAKIGNGKPIYMSNVTPRGLDNTTLYSGVTREALRGQYNRWIGLGVRYVRGVLDMDKVLRDPATPSQITAVYSSDGAATQAHPSREGYYAMALSVGVL